MYIYIVIRLGLCYFSVYMLEDGDFRTEVGKSAVCTSRTTVFEDLDKSYPTGVLQIGLYDTKLEAFRSNATNSEFSDMGKNNVSWFFLLFFTIVLPKMKFQVSTFS